MEVEVKLTIHMFRRGQQFRLIRFLVFPS